MKLAFFFTASVLFFVACTSSTQNALIDHALRSEEAIYASLQSHYYNGQSFLWDLRSEIVCTPVNPENRLKLQKIISIRDRMESIDRSAAEIIRYIDRLKLSLIERSGQSVHFRKGDENNSSKVAWSAFDENHAALPLRLNTAALSGKGSAAAEDVLLHSDGTPSAEGLRLWKKLLTFRKNIVKLTASYQRQDNFFYIEPEDINRFRDRKDLETKVMSMLNSARINAKEDAQLLADLYISVTLAEKDASGDHWITRTFRDLPLIAALHELSMLEQQILQARFFSLSHLASNYSICSEGLFDELKVVSHAPRSCRQGGYIEAQILVGAFWKGLVPDVELEKGKVVSAEDGIVTIRARADEAGTMLLKGTLGFKNRSGTGTKIPWETRVKVEGL